MSSRIGASTFCCTVSAEKSAPCWKSTPQRRLTASRSASDAVEDVDAEDPDRAGRRAVQPDDRAQEHRLAGARAADDAQHLAAVDVEVEPVVHHLGAEAVDEAAHLDDRLALRRPSGHQTSTVAKKIAKIASSTMTRKIASTTEAEVSLPRLSALPPTFSPWWQPISAITTAKNGALMIPTR